MSSEEKNVSKTNSNSSKESKAIAEKELTKMNFSDEEKQFLLNPDKTESDLDSLQNITLTQKHLAQVKRSLGTIIDNLQENPSMISRAAKFWGEIPLWKRICGGVVISGPTLFIGMTAQISFLITISGLSTLVYTGGGIALDDHYYHTQNITQKLKDGIFSIAEILELTISALDTIRKQLTVEVEKFKAENEKLTESIMNLNEEVDTLSAQVEVYIKTEQLLRKQKTDLEHIATTLKKDLEKQDGLFETNQQNLARVTEWHNRSLEQLSEKTAELSETRKSMGAEIDKAKKISATLQKTVEILSNTAINDSSQRQEFQEKLNRFLSEKAENFDQIAERMSITEQELSAVKSELNASNERYKKLLDLQESLIHRLECLDQRVEGKHMESISSNVQNPSQNLEPVKNGILLSALSFIAKPLWSAGVTKAEQKVQEIKEDENIQLISTL